MGTDGKWSCTTCDGRENVRITDVSRTEMVRKKRCESIFGYSDNSFIESIH